MSKEFSHLDAQNKPSMVNVGGKQSSTRRAVAEALLVLPDEVMRLLEGNEIRMPKGPVFQTAIIAGIMAAKKTGELIPLCHPLGLDHCDVQIDSTSPNTVRILCEASLHGKTGVEMEALTGASLAALTIYDMCKALSHDIRISSIQLIEKTGGKNDFFREGR